MVNISKRLALDHTWIYKPEDIVSIFTKLNVLGTLDSKVEPLYPLINSVYLIDEWRSKGCEDLLAITYMCANNIMPVLYFHNKNNDAEDFRENLSIFILEPFKALDKYFTEPDLLFIALENVRNKIAKDYYWDENMEYLEDQLIFVMNEFGHVS